MKIKVKVKPASGRARNVEVDATLTTVGEALDAAGLSADNMKITVDGNAATTATTISEKSQITLTEKARGS